jgi:hypothetical protein
LFVEEAQLFIPQRCGAEEARMLGAYENIIRLGRNYGIGATLISQRPQSVNKEVLSQVECLCVLQVNGSHERKALEEWVQEAGADRKLVGELPGLPRGEGYVWSPSWLRIFQRVRFGTKTTFDASATPEVGKATKAALLTAVDVEALKADLQAVIASAEKDDPKALRREVARLESELRKAQSTPKPSTAKDHTEEIKEAYAVRIGHAQASLKDCKVLIESHVLPLVRGVLEAVEKLEKAIDTVDIHVQSVTSPVVSEGRRLTGPLTITEPLKLKPEPEWPKPAPRTTNRPAASDNGNLRAGARRMLTVLAQWSPSGRTEAQVAAQVQMKRTGGTWAAYKSDLKSGGYFEVRDGLWFATEAGREYVGADAPEMPSTTEEVVRLWGEKLRRGAREMLDALVRHKGRSVSRERLGEAVGMESSGGTFAAYLSDLKQAGLIVVDRDGVRANKETLFL